MRCNQFRDTFISKIKQLLDQPALDEDGWDKTRGDCQFLGSQLYEVRRRQRRLSGQVTRYRCIKSPASCLC